MQFYTDPSRESDPYALPNAEVFYMEKEKTCDGRGKVRDWETGYYWWPCFPGCLPDGDPIGPFPTEAEAIQNAQEE